MLVGQSDRSRLPACLFREGRCAHIGHPHLDGAQALGAEPLAMLGYAIPH